MGAAETPKDEAKEEGEPHPDYCGQHGGPMPARWMVPDLPGCDEGSPSQSDGTIRMKSSSVTTNVPQRYQGWSPPMKERRPHVTCIWKREAFAPEYSQIPE